MPAQTSSATFNTWPGPSGNIFGSQTLTFTRESEDVKDNVQKELDSTIFELPDPPKHELGDSLISLLGVEADDILEQKFVDKKEQEDPVLEAVKEEYNFDEIKDALDQAIVPQQQDFFYGGADQNFFQACEFLALSTENREFIAFLISDRGQNMMKNSLPIHIKTGNIFYQNFNANKIF